MHPANARVVFCPYCGGTKELLSLMSGNTFGAKFWSDHKMRAPMLPIVSPVQKCPHCGKYYLAYKQKWHEGDYPSFEQGQLSYPEWKEAYSQLLEERENKDRCKKVDEKDLSVIRIVLVQAYNDYYYRDCVAEVSPDEYSFIEKVIKDFIDSSKRPQRMNPLLIPELYREINMMKECEQALSLINYDILDDEEKIHYDGIKTRMMAGDSKVFELRF